MKKVYFVYGFRMDGQACLVREQPTTKEVKEAFDSDISDDELDFILIVKEVCELTHYQEECFLHKPPDTSDDTMMDNLLEQREDWQNYERQKLMVKIDCWEEGLPWVGNGDFYVKLYD